MENRDDSQTNLDDKNPLLYSHLSINSLHITTFLMKKKLTHDGNRDKKKRVAFGIKKVVSH